MQSILVNIAISIALMIIYGLLFAQREDVIRAKLKRATNGIFRALYVRALIQAVRGGAGVADSRNIVFILLIAIFGSGLWVQSVVNDTSHNIDHLIQVSHTLRRASQSKPSSSEPQDRLIHEQQQIADDANAIASKAEALESKARPAIIAGHFVAYSLLLLAWCGWIAWMPYVLMRRQFAHEITRFSLRIQGLANPSELADLTKAELNVRNAATLAAFVAVMRQIALRYNMPELTRSFELWSGDDERTEAVP